MLLCCAAHALKRAHNEGKANMLYTSKTGMIRTCGMAVAFAAALALAGCGGGGSSGPTAAQEAAQQLAMKQADQKMAIMTAVEAVETAVAAIDTANPTQEQIAAANEAVEAANEAIAAGTDIDTASYEGRVAELEIGIEFAENLLAANAGKTNAEAERKKKEEELAKKEEEERKRAAAANLKDSKALFAAAVEGSTRWDHILPSGAAIKAKYGAVTAVSGAASFDREKDGEALGKGGESLGMVGEWSGTMVSATNTATASFPADVVAVYTNVGEDTRIDFEDAYPTTPTVTGATSAKNVAGSGFSAGNVPKNHENGAKVTGTFDGASGTYTCGGTDCTSQIGPDDKGIQLGGTWTFKDAPGATVQRPDMTYSVFGWWLDKTDASTFAVHAFHGQTTDGGTTIAATGVTPAATLTGTAKYMGPAVGKYAMVHNDGEGPSHTAGHFTATADLMADFDESNKVTGAIKDFQGGDATMADWKVMLDSSGNSDAGSAVWHIGGNKGQAAGTTFAPAYRDANSEGDPQSLTGVWQTQFDPQAGIASGEMIGAFGATKQ